MQRPRNRVLIIDSQGNLVFIEPTTRKNVSRLYPVTGILGTTELNQTIKNILSYNPTTNELRETIKVLIKDKVIDYNYKFTFY